MIADRSAKRLVAAYYNAVAECNARALETVMDADAAIYSGNHQLSRDMFVQLLMSYAAGFSDFAVQVEAMLDIGNSIATRTLTCGRHTGIFLGHAPTGRSFQGAGSDFFLFSEGRIVEVRSLFDTMGMLHQLGLYVMTTRVADRTV